MREVIVGFRLLLVVLWKSSFSNQVFHSHGYILRVEIVSLFTAEEAKNGLVFLPPLRQFSRRDKSAIHPWKVAENTLLSSNFDAVIRQESYDQVLFGLNIEVVICR